jgi:hypothetical protein
VQGRIIWRSFLLLVLDLPWSDCITRDSVRPASAGINSVVVCFTFEVSIVLGKEFN